MEENEISEIEEKKIDNEILLDLAQIKPIIIESQKEILNSFGKTIENKIKASITKLVSANGEFVKLKTELATKDESFKQQINEKEKQIETLKDNIEERKEQLQKASEDYTEYKGRYDSELKISQKLRDEKSDLASKYTEIKAELKTKEESFRQQIDEKEKQIEKLESTNTEKDRSIKELQEQIKTNQSSTEEISEKKKILKQKLSNLEESHQKLSMEFNNLQDLKQKLDIEFNNLQEKSEKDKALLIEKNKNIETELDKLKAKITTYETLKIDKLEKAYFLFTSFKQRTRNNLRAVFETDSFLGFISNSMQWDRIDGIWEQTKRKIVNDDNEDLAELRELFLILFETYNAGYSDAPYVLINPEIGSRYNRNEQLIKNPKSDGKITTVLLEGYIFKKNNTVHKAMIEVE